MSRIESEPHETMKQREAPVSDACRGKCKWRLFRRGARRTRTKKFKVVPACYACVLQAGCRYQVKVKVKVWAVLVLCSRGLIFPTDTSEMPE
jgi:hypothetical protein